jgi:superfamily II DNA or RNA helicase
MDSMEKTLRHGQALTPFPELAFQGDLRPSQREVVELARQKLASGAERRLHVAAPPGSGKTVLGACPRISVIGSLNLGLACQLRAQMGHDL